MQNKPEITVYIDDKCPICRREVAMLRWMDRRNRIVFVDISASDFEAPRPDLDFQTLMAEIHGQTADGDWLTGVEVFRRLYSAVGLGVLVLPTRLPGISHALNWGYGVFARNRVRWFGQCDDTCRVPESKPAPASMNGDA